MLKLKGIKKDYVAGDSVVHALKGIDLEFRKSEFVAILGHSGCGKTTLLNIVGGLDQYSSGDLVINGRSTKNFSEGDWDTYRNHSVGFVFQSYNLIPHQTVLSNVELALTLSGVEAAERKEKARQALEKVGLGDQLYKKPNQMSGGQMQRLAVVVSDICGKELLVFDEPTSGLDLKSMEEVGTLTRSLATQGKVLLIITHDIEFMMRICTRILFIRDGEIVEDLSGGQKEKIVRLLRGEE